MSSEFEIREDKLNLVKLWHRENNIPFIINALKDEDPVIRAEALMILGKLGNKELYGHILIGLEDNDQHVIYCAAEALGNLGSPYALEPLINAASDNSEFVKCKAIDALGKLHNAIAVDFLIKSLMDESESVREEASCALEGMLDLGDCQVKLLHFFTDDYEMQEKFDQLYRLLLVELKMKNVLS